MAQAIQNLSVGRALNFKRFGIFMLASIAIVTLVLAQGGRSLSGSGLASITSDEFDGTSLSGAWTFVNPVGDGSVSVGGGQVTITAPAGAEHNVWRTGIGAPRIMQPVQDGDFVLEAKFDSDISLRYQLQGILAKEDDDSFLRFGNYSDGGAVRSFVAAIHPVSGSASTINTQPVTSSSTSYLRLTRTGHTWTFERSVDGTNWTLLTSFFRPFTLTEIGLYAGNVGSPSHSAVIDYFRDVTPPPPSRPDAVADAYSVDEDSVLNVAAPGVLANDTDPESDPITAILPTTPANGSVTVNADGSFTYTPDPDFSGVDTFTYKATDGSSTSEPGTVTITVNPLPDPPVADSQSISTIQDTPISLTLSGADPDGDPLTFNIVTPPANGTLSGTAPALTYNPGASFIGSDSLTFTVNDGTTTSPEATVSISVVGPNQGLIGYWSFDSGTAVDDSGSGNDGVLNGPVPITSAINGGAIELDGVDDYVSLGTLDVTPPASPTQAVSVAAWVRADALDNCSSSDCRVFSKATGTSSQDHYLMISTIKVQDIYRFRLRLKTDGITETLIAGSSDIKEGEWTHVAGTYDGSVMKLYVNGREVGSKAKTGTVDTSATAQTWIGNNPTSATNKPWKGAIDEVRLYNRGLEAYEVRQLSARGIGLITDQFDDASLAPYWTFVNQLGDGSVALVNGAAQISVPQDSTHDVWATGIDAPHIMQSVADGDFRIELKIDSAISNSIQTQGVLVKQDADNYMKFEFYSNGGTITFLAARINMAAGTGVPLGQITVPVVVPQYMSVTRTGDIWRIDRSSDGVVWLDMVAFIEAFTLSEIGLYGGNFNGPAHTAVFDFFKDASPLGIATQDDIYAVDEDTVLNIAAPGILANDLDPQGDPLTATLETPPTNGTLVMFPDGSFTYTPDPDYGGPDSFTYRATDGASSSLVATVSINVTPVPDVPVAHGQSLLFEQDSSTPITLTGTDGDGDSLTFAISTSPLHGSLTGTMPNLTYTPDAGYSGLDSFEFTASDAISTSPPATVDLNIHPLNDPPVVANDSYTVDEDTPLSVVVPGVLANDFDIEGHPMTAELVTPPASGTLTFNSDGSFIYQPDPEFNGSDSFTYQVLDLYEISVVATVDITINPVNDVPVANAQSRNTSQDASADILLTGFDVDGDALTFSVISQPANGSVTGTGENVTYTPDPGYLGLDSFQFTVSDGVETSAPATVQITMSPTGLNSDEFDGQAISPFWTFINPLGDGTVAIDAGYASISVPQGTTHDIWKTGINAPRLMQPVNNVDFQVEAKFDSAVSLGYQTQGIIIKQDANRYVRMEFHSDGNVTRAFGAEIDVGAGVGSARLFQVIPSDVPRYMRVERIGDIWVLRHSSNGTNWVTLPGFTVSGFVPSEIGVYGGNINGPAHTALIDYFRDITPTIPVAGADAYSTDEDVALNVAAPGVLGNDIDAGGDPLTPQLMSTTSNGALTLNVDGSFSYVPNPEYFGQDSFTYRVSDGTHVSDVVTVTLTVNSVNDVPVANAQSILLEQESSTVITLTGTDADGDPITFAVTTQPTHGILSGAAPSLTYTPSSGYFGPDSFAFTASDGTATSPEATVSITVFELNEAPIAVNDSYSLDEDTVLNVAAPGVLSNDSDPELDPMTSTLVTPPTNGTVVLNADGSFTYTPDEHFNGADSFAYLASDQYESSPLTTVTLTVNAVPDAPTATPQSVTTDVDQAVGITLTGNDPEGDPITFAVASQPSNGTLSGTAPNLTYTPNSAYLGADSFTFTATDATGTSAPATVQISVTDPSDGTIVFFYGENQKFNNVGRPQKWVDIHGKASDPDGLQSLTFSLNGGPEQPLTIGPDGRRLIGYGDFDVQILFNDLVLGDNTVVVTATDNNNDVVQASMTLNYPGRNIWPTTYSINWASVTDIQDVVQVVDGEWSVGPNGVTLGSDKVGYDRLIAVGDTLWTDYTVTVPVTVHSVVPNAPLRGVGMIVRWTGHTDSPVDCGQPVCGWVPYGNEAWYEWDPATGGHSGAFDGSHNAMVDNSGLVLQLGVTYMFKVEVETINGDSWYRKKVWVQGDPEPNDWLVEIVRNGTLSSGSILLIAHFLDATFGNILITPIGGVANTPPAASNDSYVLNEDNTLNTAAPGVLGNDSDTESDPMSAVLASDVTNGTLTLNPDGSFDYTPDQDFNGVDSFTYRATDAFGSSNLATVTLNVTAVNDAPVANNQGMTVEQATPTNFVLSGTDVDGDPLTFNVTVQPQNGTLSGIAPNLTYTSDGGYTGPDSIVFTVSDGVLTSGPGSMQFTVVPPNTAPVATGEAYVTDEDVVLNVAAPGVLSNDTDANGDSLTASLVSTTSNGTLTLNADGSFDYTPNPDYNGVDSFTYNANDGLDDSNTVTVTITVNATNDAPVANNGAASTEPDTAVAVNLSASDIDGDTLTYTITILPANGTLSGTAPALTYTPDTGFQGVDTFSFTASDGSATSNTAVVEIEVLALANGLIGYWSFDNNNGDDSSGNGNNGTVSGATFINGPSSAGAALFDGFNDHIDLGVLDVTSGGSPTDKLTIAAWVRPDDLANCNSRDCRIFSKATGVSTQQHNVMVSTIAVGSQTRLRFRLKTDGVTGTLVAGSGALQNGTWVHVAAVYDGAQMMLYLDGQLVGSTAKTGTVTNGAGISTWIGSNPPSATSRPWEGAIDEVRLYDRALTQAEIQSLM